jgi:hypothetical protein
MAKEVVYKPVIDVTELPQQLEAIQAQLNVAMASQSFAATPVANQPFAAAASAAGHSFSDGISNTVSQSFQGMTEANTAIAGQIQTASEAMRLGAYKFQNSLQLQGLMQPVGEFLTPDMSIDTIDPTSFADAGFFSSLGSSFGLGYDPNTAGMTRADYKRNAARRHGSAEVQGGMGAGLAGFAAGSVVGWGVGLAATAVGGPIFGAAAGFAADFVVDDIVGGAMRWGNRHNIERERLGGFIQGGSFRFAGGSFDQAEATQAAMGVQKIFDSKELSRLQISQAQAEGIISEFTAGGGFDSVRSAEEYTTKVDELVTSSQKVAQLLHTSLREATSVMAGLENGGITGTPVETLQLIQRMEARSGVAGMTTNEFMNIGMQGASMVQGTGIDFNTGFTGMQDATLAIRNAIATGAISQDFVRHAGGMGQAAGMINQIGFDFGSSPTGMVLQAGGLPMGADFNSVLASAANNITNPQSLLGVIGGQNQWASEQGPLGLAVSRLDLIRQMSEVLQMPLNSMEEFTGFALRSGFASNPLEVQAMVAATSADPLSAAHTEFKRLTTVAEGSKLGLPGKVVAKWREWGHAIGTVYDSISYDDVEAENFSEIGLPAITPGMSYTDIRAAAERRDEFQDNPNSYIADPDNYLDILSGRYHANALTIVGRGETRIAQQASYGNVSDVLADLTQVGKRPFARTILLNKGVKEGRHLDALVNRIESKEGKAHGKKIREGRVLASLDMIGEQLKTDLLGESKPWAKYADPAYVPAAGPWDTSLSILSRSLTRLDLVLEDKDLDGLEAVEALEATFRVIEEQNINPEFLEQNKIIFDNPLFRTTYDEWALIKDTDDRSEFLLGNLSKLTTGLKPGTEMAVKSAQAFSDINPELVALLSGPLGELLDSIADIVVEVDKLKTKTP